MHRHTRLLSGIMLFAFLGSTAVEGASQRKTPYWGSIAAGRARMRTGPARTYPASWLYQRADLPVRVTASFKEWRRVVDPDGTEGWMLANLLSERRTAVIHGDGAAQMLERPAAGARLLWRAAPGVVGRISQCANGWCRFDVQGQAGYVEVGSLWGVHPDEVLP